MERAGSAHHFLRSIRSAARFAVTAAGLLSICMFPLAQPASAQTPPPDAESLILVTTVIEPGCVLKVTVRDETQLTGSFTVSTDGKIHFTYADEDGNHKTEWDVAVGGKTADLAREAVEESLKEYIRYPEVQVSIVRLPRIKVDVTGPVKTKGKVDLRKNVHLSDALQVCGCLPEADLDSILITRGEKKPGDKSAKSHTIVVNYGAFLRGETDVDPVLQEGDKILINAKPVTTYQELKLVRIVGEVAREASIPFSPGMTVNTAIDRAGGLSETADRDKIRLIRGADGRLFELTYEKISSNDPVHNLPMEPGDLIIVGVRDRGMRFAVLGEVTVQKTFDWSTKDKMTVMRALELAGGPTKKGDLRKGLLRKGYLLNPNVPRDIAFDVDAIVRGKQPDWEIEAGDAIYIPPKKSKPSFLQQVLPLMLQFLPLGL